MLQYYICLGIVLTGILVLGLGLVFGIILYFVIGNEATAYFYDSASTLTMCERCTEVRILSP